MEAEKVQEKGNLGLDALLQIIKTWQRERQRHIIGQRGS